MSIFRCTTDCSFKVETDIISPFSAPSLPSEKREKGVSFNRFDFASLFTQAYDIARRHREHSFLRSLWIPNSESLYIVDTWDWLRAPIPPFKRNRIQFGNVYYTLEIKRSCAIVCFFGGNPLYAMAILGRSCDIFWGSSTNDRFDPERRSSTKRRHEESRSRKRRYNDEPRRSRRKRNEETEEEWQTLKRRKTTSRSTDRSSSHSESRDRHNRRSDRADRDDRKPEAPFVEICDWRKETRPLWQSLGLLELPRGQPLPR